MSEASLLIVAPKNKNNANREMLEKKVKSRKFLEWKFFFCEIFLFRSQNFTPKNITSNVLTHAWSTK